MRKLHWLVISLLVGVLASGAYVLWKSPNMANSDKAAWTQAIGSLVGLFIAIYVPAWQHSQTEKIRRQEIREANWRTLRLVWLLTSRAANSAELIGISRTQEGTHESPKDRKRQSEGMGEIQDALESIPLAAIATVEAIQYFMKVKRLVNEAVQEIDRCPLPTADMECGKLYGRPWIRLYNELKEAATLLGWQAEQHQDDNTKQPEPQFLDAF